jgi:hypothetical protein
MISVPKATAYYAQGGSAPTEYNPVNCLSQMPLNSLLPASAYYHPQPVLGQFQLCGGGGSISANQICVSDIDGTASSLCGALGPATYSCVDDVKIFTSCSNCNSTSAVARFVDVHIIGAGGAAYQAGSGFGGGAGGELDFVIPMNPSQVFTASIGAGNLSDGGDSAVSWLNGAGFPVSEIAKGGIEPTAATATGPGGGFVPDLINAPLAEGANGQDGQPGNIGGVSPGQLVNDQTMGGHYGDGGTFGQRGHDGVIVFTYLW